MQRNFFLSFFLFLFAGYLNINAQTAAFIGGQGIESDSAFNILLRPYKSAERISLQNLTTITHDILWIHSSDTSGNILNPASINTLKNYVRSGGNLLLSLEAFRLVYDLGLEKNKPQMKYITAVDEGYGRKSGFHAFIEHPVFSGLNGGSYVWDATEDNTTRMWGFFENNLPEGKTVAVDWSYITLKEDSRIILEYQTGKGRVLAIGGYTFYSPGNRNKRQLTKFTENCFDFLTGKTFNEKKYYWNYNPPSVVQNPDLIMPSDFNKSTAWKEPEVLNIKSLYASDNYWDIAGQRILIMGKEKGGIDEIWIHPFMALRDYEVGIKFSYRDSIYWLNNERPSFEVSPAYIKRIYNFKRAFLSEVITADPENPSGVIHYEYRGVYPARLFIKVKSNLRFMWPYSEIAFRQIDFNYGGNYLVFSTNPQFLAAAIGINKKPFFINAGQYENYVQKDSLFEGIPAKEMLAAGIFAVDLEMNDNLDVSLSGSSLSQKEMSDAYLRTAVNPSEVYKKSIDYVSTFFKNTISVSTPDENINTGIKWALAGSDKFYVNTPGIGKSLVAGYSTTARGWNGGHKVNGRPGYAWYFGRDAQWSGLALLDYGDFNKVKDAINTFNKFQDLNGKIYHELTTSGAVHYDAADATPLYIILCGKYLKHSGDIEFIRENWNHIEKAIEYCYSTDTDGDNLIENTNVGHGWVEGGSLYGAHTTLYLASCWAEALKEAQYIAGLLNFKDKAERYLNSSKSVINIINRDFWNSKDEFYYYGKLKDGNFNPEKTALPSIPLLFKHAEKDKALKLLDDYASHGFTADWGVRIISSENPLFKPTGYHYGSIWPLFTGWISLAEYAFGNYLQGFSHVISSLNVYKNFTRGYVEEVLNGAEYKPSGVCPHQCWSETMVLQPLLEGMLGFECDAMNNDAALSPRFPADWKNVNIDNIKIGNNSLDFHFKKEQDITCFFNTGREEINMHFNPALPSLSTIQDVTLNGKSIDFNIEKTQQNLILRVQFAFSGKAELKVKLKEGVSVLPFINNPVEGDSSKGLRIISTEYGNNEIKVVAECKSNTEPELRIYSPNFSLSAEGGIINKRGEDVYLLKIPFDAVDDFSRKEIKIKIQ